ncbi:MAG: PEP-CTERM sorting domain-containing protein [Thermoanaerobaculia bacterium]|nr:PEP-CTERM sorting domain-containing protein [Thermoanaerobaculia bacterium]
MRSPLFAAAVLIALAAPVAAQNNTGGSGWSVNVFTVSSGTWSGFYTAFAPATAIPTPWQDNNASARWISAWPNYSTSPGAGDYNRATDANARYQYLYRYTFAQPVGTGLVGFTMGWDNILKGFQFDGGGVLSPPSAYEVGLTNERTVDSYFGFCRSSDAIHNSTDAVCTADFRVPTTNGARWVDFFVWGDGQTDGMYLEWDGNGVPTDVVPEPATMTLLATGLIGLAASSIRRRRKLDA